MNEISVNDHLMVNMPLVGCWAYFYRMILSDGLKFQGWIGLKGFHDKSMLLKWISAQLERLYLLV